MIMPGVVHDTNHHGSFHNTNHLSSSNIIDCMNISSSNTTANSRHSHAQSPAEPPVDNAWNEEDHEASDATLLFFPLSDEHMYVISGIHDPQHQQHLKDVTMSIVNVSNKWNQSYLRGQHAHVHGVSSDAYDPNNGPKSYIGGFIGCTMGTIVGNANLRSAGAGE